MRFTRLKESGEYLIVEFWTGSVYETYMELLVQGVPAHGGWFKLDGL